MAGDPLSLPEMQRLLEQVLGTEEALRCPHGRPTLALLSKAQLDRQFGRLG
jgi:DNA mismatch repair protein MutL